MKRLKAKGFDGSPYLELNVKVEIKGYSWGAQSEVGYSGCQIDNQCVSPRGH